MRPLLKVRVRGRQLIRLQKVYGRTRCARTRLRALIVLLSHDGYSIEEMAQLTRQSDETVRRWLHRFLQEGCRAGQTHLNLAKENIEEVIVVPTSFETSGLDAHLGGLFLFQEIKGHVAQDSEVLWGMGFANAAVILPEGDIQHPVHRVFNAPMRAHGRAQLSSLSPQATEKVARFPGRFALNPALTFDQGQTGEALPERFVGQPVNVRHGPSATGFHSPMIAIHAFRKAMRDAPEPDLSGIFEEKLNLLLQRPVVAFQGEYVIASLVDDLLRNLFLAAHSVHGHNTTRQLQQLQQLGNGRNLIGLVIHFDLSQHQVIGAGPGTHHVNGGSARGAVKGVAQGLAVDGNDLSLGEIPDSLNPVDEAVLELPRVQASKDTGKGIMGRDPIGQVQKASQPRLFLLAVGLDLGPAIGATNHRTDGNDENIEQVVPFGAIQPRIG